MKVLFLLGVYAAAVIASVGKVEYHINSMLESFPASPNLIQMEATMLSRTTSVDVRDEIAALLFKMQKDIQKEEALETQSDRKAQDACEISATQRVSTIANAKTRQVQYHAKKVQHHDAQKVIPGLVLKKEATIRKVKSSIFKGEAKIKQSQRERDTARDGYLKSMADFNQALDDIDKLRTLVETGLNNRGQGANSNNAKFTSSPTTKVVTAPPTKHSYDKKVTHKKVEAGAFVQNSLIELSNENLSLLSREETVQTMKGIYSNIRNTLNANPMVLAVVDTLDATMTQIEEGSAVDKIRSLLLQVRNELQKSKREQSQAEIIAIASWKDRKLQLRNAVNELRIEWTRVYSAKANLWRTYGNEWQLEGQAMRSFSIFRDQQEKNEINLSFETVTCKTQHQDYKLGSNQRHGQLQQIGKALNLLSKFGLAGKYGKMVRESIKDINVGLCRVFDDKSKWVSIADKYEFKRKATPSIGFSSNAWNIYPNQGKNGEKFVCLSKIEYTFTCQSDCTILSTDKRLPTTPDSKWPIVGSILTGDKFNKKQKFTIRLDKPMTLEAFRLVAMQYKGVVQDDVSVYVVPGCNCLKRDHDYDVKANQHKEVANVTQKKSLLAAKEEESEEEE